MPIDRPVNMRTKSPQIFGTPTKQHRFDIPFHARVGTEFLAFLLALMTFLCVLAAGMSVSLNRMADLWTSGLADTLMVEIPASQNTEANLSQLRKILEKNTDVKSVNVMDEDDIDKLVSPWLGKGTIEIADLPVPGLINIELYERDKDDIRKIAGDIKNIASEAKLDAHDEWLLDLAKLSRALQVASTAFVIIIAIVTALTVSGAVKSRMAIHHMELELLHVMGASDRYITRQFQKYIFMLAGKGILIGLVLALIATGIGKLLMVNMPDAVPGFDLMLRHALVPPVIAGILLMISLLSARRTALKVLREMP